MWPITNSTPMMPVTAMTAFLPTEESQNATSRFIGLTPRG